MSIRLSIAPLVREVEGLFPSAIIRCLKRRIVPGEILAQEACSIGRLTESGTIHGKWHDPLSV